MQLRSKIAVAGALGSILMVMAFQNCAPFKSGLGKTSLSSNTGSSLDANPEDPAASALSFKAFSETLSPTLKTNCAGCHSSITPKLASSDDAASFKVILDNKFVDLSTPNNSHLVSLISSGHNSVATSVSTEIYEKIRLWGQMLVAPAPAPQPTVVPIPRPTVTPMPVPAVTPKPTTTPTPTPTVAVISSADAFKVTLYPVLTQSCGGCHSASVSPKFATANSIDSHGVIVASKLVAFSNSASSRLVLKIQGGHASVSTAVAATIRSQVDAWAKKVKDSGGVLPLP